MAFKAKILKDSINVAGVRLTTMELTLARFVHSEMMTHRVFSRNAASSRAIPAAKMIKKVWAEPVVPVWFGKNQSGMQANEELTGWRLELAKFVWMLAGKFACVMAWLMMKLGMHKQLVNRVIEPWSWITVIVTATEWENFFALRCHPDAQPEIRTIAVMARREHALSKPTLVTSGYHLPLVDDLQDLQKEGYSEQDIVKISIGRCARVSYLTHDGKRDPKADLQLCDRLYQSGHCSPFEHAAQPSDGVEFHANFKGWVQYRKTLPFESDFSKR